MKEIIAHQIHEVLKELFPGKSFEDLVHVQRPTEDAFGDYTSNIAFVLARSVAKVLDARTGEIYFVQNSSNPHEYKSPRDYAEAIKTQLEQKNIEGIQEIKIEGPGHLNFFLSTKAYSDVLEKVLYGGDKYGNLEIGKGIEVNNEFISANPTGPLHLGNGRGGFYADALSNVLRKTGYTVTNEYYVNDAGEQVMKLGHSVLKDSEAVYGGEYIEKLAEKLQGETDVRTIGEQAAKIILEEMIQPVARDVMRVRFDEWILEHQIIKDGYVDKALKLLEEQGKTFENEGALWLRTTEYGDDKDRVLVKSDGMRTYFASDCGYLLSKKERGFKLILETWGADHHGYIRRFQAAAEALGIPKEQVHFTIVQLVKLVKDGEEVRMSKRAGNVVGIDELIETVGHDVARFFFLMYSPDTHMNFDLGLAEEHSQKNPVYYVEYAHARMVSILRKAEDTQVTTDGADLTLLIHPKERELMRELLFFPELLEMTVQDFTVHRLPQYAIRLADKFHSFYDACRVLESGDTQLTAARLELVSATKIVLKETLALLGIEAPEKM